MSPYYTREELLESGFSTVGEAVRISRKSSLYEIAGGIGDNVRIDDFCILKGELEIGSFVHIAAYCSVSGARGKVTLGDFSTLSNRVSIFTGSDDYSATSLNNPTVPSALVTTRVGDVTIGKAVIVGPHCVILPGAFLCDACTVGAQCILAGNIAAGAVYVSGSGRPKEVRTRDVDAIMKLAAGAMEAWRSRDKSRDY